MDSAQYSEETRSGRLPILSVLGVFSDPSGWTGRRRRESDDKEDGDTGTGEEKSKRPEDRPEIQVHFRTRVRSGMWPVYPL